jgi:hypothetical protein
MPKRDAFRRFPTATSTAEKLKPRACVPKYISTFRGSPTDFKVKTDLGAFAYAKVVRHHRLKF